MKWEIKQSKKLCKIIQKSLRKENLGSQQTKKQSQTTNSGSWRLKKGKLIYSRRILCFLRPATKTHRNVCKIMPKNQRVFLPTFLPSSVLQGRLLTHIHRNAFPLLQGPFVFLSHNEHSHQDCCSVNLLQQSKCFSATCKSLQAI